MWLHLGLFKLVFTHMFFFEIFAPALIKIFIASRCPFRLAFIIGVPLLRRRMSVWTYTLSPNAVWCKSHQAKECHYYILQQTVNNLRFVTCVDITASCKKNLANCRIADESSAMKWRISSDHIDYTSNTLFDYINHISNHRSFSITFRLSGEQKKHSKGGGPRWGCSCQLLQLSLYLAHQPLVLLPPSVAAKW